MLEIQVEQAIQVPFFILKIQVEQAIQDMKLDSYKKSQKRAHKNSKKCWEVKEIRKKEIIYTMSFPLTVM